MDYRSVGTSALRALDSDPLSHTLPVACLLRAGAAQYCPDQGPPSSALLAYLPGTEGGVGRGSLLALTTAQGAPPGASPTAVLAAAEFVRAYHASLSQRAGQALRSAVDGTVRHMGALTHSAGAPDLAFAYAAVQDGQVWIAARGGVCAYVLRGARGQWAGLDVAHAPDRRDPEAPTYYAPVALESGDVLLLLSRPVQVRLTKRLIRRCLLGLIEHRPRIRAQQLADTLVRMAAVDGGTDPLAALVVRCHAVLAPDAARSYHWPAAYERALRLPADAPWNLPPPAELTARPVTAPTVSEHSAPRLRSVVPGARPDEPRPAPGGAPPAPGAVSPPAPVAGGEPRPDPAHPAPAPAPAPPSAFRPRQPVVALACALALGAGVSLVSGTVYYLLSVASLAGIVGLLAFWWRSVLGRSGGPRSGSAAGASARLRAVSRATARPPAAPFTLPVPEVGADGEPHPLVPSKALLALPHDRALQTGCLDIVSLRDANGRIAAQVVLLCPDPLLTHPSGQPDGLLVVLHDLVADRRSAVAWLAPGRVRALQEQTAQAVLAYSGAAGPIQVAGGSGPFELVAGRTRVLLSLERCRFLERFRKCRLVTFQVRVVAARMCP
jgi:hypothetical protein